MRVLSSCLLLLLACGCESKDATGPSRASASATAAASAPVSATPAATMSAVAQLPGKRAKSIDMNDPCMKVMAGASLEDLKKIYPSEKYPVDYQSFTGQTVLHSAALKGRLDVAKYAIEKGIDTQLKSDRGRTALDLAKTQAVSKRDPKLIEYLESASKK